VNSNKKKQKHISNNAKLNTKRTERRLLFNTRDRVSWYLEVEGAIENLRSDFEVPYMKQITLLTDTDAWWYRSMREYRKQPEGRRIVDHAFRPAKRTFSFI